MAKQKKLTLQLDQLQGKFLITACAMLYQMTGGRLRVNQHLHFPIDNAFQNFTMASDLYRSIRKQYEETFEESFKGDYTELYDIKLKK